MSTREGTDIMANRVLAAGALLAGAGVVLGAFGAHALRARFGAAELGWWETAVAYQMWHGIALVAFGAGRVDRIAAPAWLLGAGAAIFSGTLYVMALTGLRWLGAVTPVGGLLMIAGWGLLAWRGLRD